MKKSIGTTADPEFAIPSPDEKTPKRRSKRKPNDAQAQAAQPGSGVAPGTGEQQETTLVQQADAAHHEPDA